jgi:hypothetical protein
MELDRPAFAIDFNWSKRTDIPGNDVLLPFALRPLLQIRQCSFIMSCIESALPNLSLRLTCSWRGRRQASRSLRLA